jgi:hypothetical protein
MSHSEHRELTNMLAKIADAVDDGLQGVADRITCTATTCTAITCTATTCTTTTCTAIASFSAADQE